MYKERLEQKRGQHAKESEKVIRLETSEKANKPVIFDPRFSFPLCIELYWVDHCIAKGCACSQQTHPLTTCVMHQAVGCNVVHPAPPPCQAKGFSFWNSVICSQVWKSCFAKALLGKFTVLIFNTGWIHWLANLLPKCWYLNQFLGRARL